MALMLLIVIFLRLFFVLHTQGSQSTSHYHNISLGSSLTPGETRAWVSPSGLFAFGFYPQDDGFMIGIWLETKPEITVVWTANRDGPLLSSNSTIKLTGDGWLHLHSNGDHKNITRQRTPATSASMLDTGNFLLYNHSFVIWESFYYPCDTVLGGQELTADDQLVSSVSPSLHTSGNFVLDMQYDGNLVAYPLNTSRERNDAYWATGTYRLSGFVSMYLSHSGSLCLVEDDVTRSVLNPPTTSSSINEIVIFRATLQWDGNFVLYSHRFASNYSSLRTMKEWEALQDPCDAKGICGSNSYCVSNGGNFSCHCFPGFLFFDETRSCYRNFTDEEACNRKGLKLSYSITPVENVKLREHYSYSVMDLTKEDCRQYCLDDCNCWAGLYVVNGSCKILKVPIIYAVRNKSILATVFIKTSSPHDPEVKGWLSGSTKAETETETQKLVYVLAITLGCLAFMCTLMAFSAFFFYRVSVNAHGFESISAEDIDLEEFRDQFALRSFSFDELQKATDGFKQVIGRNSYGEVYKGFISKGKTAVSVKRLERMFEGEGWFRAEVTAIAQTHHRNLVGLLGFCIRGATKLLVYEFMSNGSLADLLFNVETPIGWNERVRVALDVARGILYLHEECEARIIHCNITPHNILFDESWTAKISDFGLSKLLRSNQSGTLLTGDMGTRGYVAPEWHKNTFISTKVDVYSFGVVLLEILCCGKEMEVNMNLSTLVYNCFAEKDWSKLMINGDEEVDAHMLEKMVKVGLLCIQEDPDARPSIKNVILMLEGTTDIPNPPSPSPPSLI